MLLPLVAQAFALVECDPAVVVDSLPRNGAVDVPVDVAPAFVFDLGVCGRGVRSAALTRESDGAVVASVDGDDIDPDAMVEVFPDADLDPNTTYVLTLTDSPEVVVSFTTGDGVSKAPEGVPTLTVRAASRPRNGDDLQIEATAAPAGDDDTLVVFVDDEGYAKVGARSALGDEVDGEWTEPGGASRDEVCYSVIQRGYAGDRLESDPDCLLVEPSCGGCATSGGAPGALSLLVAGIALVRRRK